MDIIKIEKNEIRLNSGIAEENFGKMSYAQILKEEGVLAKGVKTDNGYEFKYEPWTFDDVQAFDEDGTDSKSENANRKVFYCGKIPFFSKNVSTLLDALDDENAFKAGFAFMHLLTDNAKQKRELNLVGAGGILIEFDGKENVTILILPQNLFLYSVAGLSEKEKAVLNNWWLNPTLTGVQAYRFMRAVIAYKVLTGNVPYPATDIIERNADILDEKFLPLEYCINGINLNLSDRITDELILNVSSVVIPGKKQKKSIAEKIKEDAKINPNKQNTQNIPKSDAEKEQFFSEKYFKAITEFPFDLFTEAALKNPTSSVSDETFEARKSEYLKKQEKRVGTKRTVRRNLTKIIVIAVISVVALIITGNSIKSSRENETTKGLTAEQTVETFFKSVNTLNTTLATNITKGRNASRYADTVSQIYVMGKNRQAYSNDEGFLNPAAYFLYLTGKEKIGKAGVFGVTNLKINGKDSDIDIVPYLINQKPKAITTDNGIEVYNKMEKEVQAEYYELHSEENGIIVEFHKDIFTLTFKKNKWIITDIEEKESQEKIKFDENSFYEKYFLLLEEKGGNQIDTLKILKTEYDWLPKESVIRNEIAYKKARDEEFRMQYGL